METMTIQFPLTYRTNEKMANDKLKFNVTKDTLAINLHLHHADHIWGTYMVYDPSGNLRAQYLTGKTPQPVVIHEQQHLTSPYTISGPIQVGTWTVDFVAGISATNGTDTPYLEVQFDGEFRQASVDEIYWNEEDAKTLSLTSQNDHKILNKERRWYKGDLHTHTIYSDGQMTREDNMISARNQQLDFFVATDHNIVPSSWVNDASILVLPGLEVTAPLGHFNIINTNTSPFVKHQLQDLLTEQGMNKIISSEYGNALISINHPFLTEWKWLLKDTSLNQVDTLEIWNDPTYADNQQATEFALNAWDLLLKDGHRITGVAGSDSHLRPDEAYDGSDKPSLIGDPGTFVYCEGLSIDNLVQSIKNGHVFVSRGEQIELKLNHLIPGDQSDLKVGEVEARVHTTESLIFEWIMDGDIIIQESGTSSRLQFDWPDNAYHYIRVNIRTQDGRLYGFTNPIYFNDKEPTLETWGQLLDMKGYQND